MYMGSFDGWSRFHYQTRIEEKGKDTIWTSQKHFRVKNLNFQIKGTKEEIRDGIFFPVVQIIEEKNLLVLMDNRIKMQNQWVDATAVSAPR